MKRSLIRGRCGFNLIELLVVMSIMFTLALIGFPAFLEILRREKLRGSGHEAATLMRMARAESIKRQIPSGVTQSFSTNELVAFTDLDRDGFYTLGDRIVGRFVLPTGVGMYGPGDVDGGNQNNANVGFPDAGVPGGPGTVMFNSLGSANAVGSFRLSDARNTNFIEVRVEPAQTGRVALQKYDIENPGDANDPENWEEPGEEGDPWEWEE